MPTDKVKSLIDTRQKPIAQVGIVVRDAPKTAIRYSEIFGIGPWVFYDFVPEDIILHDEAHGRVECCARAGMGMLGKIQIELLQPMYGPSTYMEFLREHGEGIHHISFGRVDDHDEIVSAARDAGIGIEMQGLLGGAVRFTYMATQKRLGTIFEVVKPPPEGAQIALRPWGTYLPEKPALITMEGKKVAQIGIVVEDIEKAAMAYWEILGIGPWILMDFTPPHVSDVTLFGITVGDIDSHVKAAIADHHGLQIELLQPVSGPGTQMDFLRQHGGGVHHLSFGEIEDHDEVVAALKNLGVAVEMTGKLGGGAFTFTYMASQKDLGTIVEFVKGHPGVKNTIIPYASYPPAI